VVGLRAAGGRLRGARGPGTARMESGPNWSEGQSCGPVSGWSVPILSAGVPVRIRGFPFQVGSVEVMPRE